MKYGIQYTVIEKEPSDYTDQLEAFVIARKLADAINSKFSELMVTEVKVVPLVEKETSVVSEVNTPRDDS